jgi:hypothetical protein
MRKEQHIHTKPPSTVTKDITVANRKPLKSTTTVAKKIVWKHTTKITAHDQFSDSSENLNDHNGKDSPTKIKASQESDGNNNRENKHKSP